MKIGLVSPYDFAYPGGVTNHISHLAEQFTKWGQEVKIIGPSSNPQRTADNGNFIPMGRPVPLPSGGSIARVSLSVWLEPRIKNLLRQEAFDVIHLHEPLGSFLPLCILYLSKSVNIGTFHAFHGGTKVYGMSSFFLKRWFRKLDGRIAVSKPAMSFISRHFPAEYQIIPNGIDVDHFSADVSPFPQWKDGMINILFVGRMEKRKGLKYLLSAFSDLKWSWPNLRLLVVGPGNLDEDSQRILSSRNIQDVVFLGNVPYSDLPRYHRTADIFCAPNTGKESWGLILGEAMAAGRPIVATDIEGFASVVTHGEEGLLVKPKKAELLAEAIATLVKSPDLRAEMGARGRQRVEEFRWERVAATVLDYYKSFIESPSTVS